MGARSRSACPQEGTGDFEIVIRTADAGDLDFISSHSETQMGVGGRQLADQ